MFRDSRQPVVKAPFRTKSRRPTRLRFAKGVFVRGNATMREERGNIAGDIVIKEPYTLWGSIAGTVTALEGSKFYMRGAIYGNLEAENGGRIHVLGNISGNVAVKPGSKVIIGGNIGGDVINHGGRLFIENTAHVLGKVKTHSGETKIEPEAKVGSRD
jgi:cytoskeletal protein CcmA (bactofilin family)